MKKWVISLISTILVWGAGIFGFFYIKESFPKKLTASSALIVNAKTAEEEKTSTDLKEIIHNTQKLVVKVKLADGSLGSGFLYNNRGDIVTNAHVVANEKDVTVMTSDSREFSGTVIGISQETDVAVVRVPGLEGTSPLKIARDRKGEVGDAVLALGSPLGLQNTVTTGIISGIDRDLDIEPYHYEDVYQISAPITNGNSGGPLVDSQTGEVLGINSAGIEKGAIGFSIPIVSILHIIEGWSESPMTNIPEVAMGVEGYTYEDELTLEDYSSYLVNYFYEGLNYGDYVTAYSLLGSSWQSDLSYEKFRSGYLNTLSVTIDDLSATSEDDKASVVVIISAKERNNSSTTLSKYKATYEIRYENDQLKLISGRAEKIN
ncbi:trypsin-like peptidase domain-containing protein [Bacillus sp. JJ1532]|uniref:S1C family serine protease n=1 Tax=Bacillus sp. JJ1532 TaxID=3122958 RepID=UPI002FFFF68C